jgi:phospholipase C
VIDPPGNRGVLAEQMTAPFNAPPDPHAAPTMDGFVADYISAFTAEMGRQPTYEEYAQIMTGYSPEQVPVISAIARGFAAFDHWHCDVPSQTFTNPSFYHAASASGMVVNGPPYDIFPLHNDAETIFERLEAAGLPWRVYVDPGMHASATGAIHAPRLERYFAANFSALADFFDDAERGRLPAYAFIEPCLLHAHNDYHPAFNALFPGVSADPPASVLGGEELLARIYTAVRASSANGSNFANTLFLVAFDEHGGNYDHVAPPRAHPPDPAAPPGQMGFRFDRLGVRIPTLAVSAYIDPQTVITGAYRNTSLIATLRDRWNLGPPLTARDATAPSIAPVLARATPRPPQDWPEVTPRPVPQLTSTLVSLDQPLPPLGKSLLGVLAALDTKYTGHIPDIDPKTATGQQARDYITDRTARIWPGLLPHPA